MSFYFFNSSTYAPGSSYIGTTSNAQVEPCTEDEHPTGAPLARQSENIVSCNRAMYRKGAIVNGKVVGQTTIGIQNVLRSLEGATQDRELLSERQEESDDEGYHSSASQGDTSTQSSPLGDLFIANGGRNQVVTSESTLYIGGVPLGGSNPVSVPEAGNAVVRHHLNLQAGRDVEETISTTHDAKDPEAYLGALESQGEADRFDDSKAQLENSPSDTLLRGAVSRKSRGVSEESPDEAPVRQSSIAILVQDFDRTGI